MLLVTVNTPADSVFTARTQRDRSCSWLTKILSEKKSICSAAGDELGQKSSLRKRVHSAGAPKPIDHHHFFHLIEHLGALHFGHDAPIN